MEGFSKLAPTMPAYVLYPILAVSLALIAVAMVRMRHRVGGFLLGAVWLRYAMSAMGAIVTTPVAAGMSLIALSSTAVAGIGLTQINLKNLRLSYLLPIYVLMVVAIVSAIVNVSYGGLVGVLTKYVYLIVFTLGVYEALKGQSDGRFMRLLLLAFVTPLVLQALSIAMGLGKATENDNSTSYIGGYDHEAHFSVILATCAVVAAFTTRLNTMMKALLVIVCVAGIYLANYRTTIIAIAPVLIVFFGLSPIRRVVMKDRPLVVGFAILLISILVGLAGLFLASRFADIGTATSGDVNLFKPPYAYTDEESRILSGRPRIWAGYIFAWMNGEWTTHLFGFGPETWRGNFRLYAHNTLVNALFEYGIVGVIATLALWMSMLAAALRVRHANKGVLVGAHIGFICLNMGTMPMWMVEGNILYGIICGYTLYLLTHPQEVKARAPQRMPAQAMQQRAMPQPPRPAA
ncbi:MAG: O-antigen ligase family protein [Hyphomonadaceae bacterium]|nr:O-antigen ligase family protein [Hyphomonadaceae bacterium]